MLSRSIAKHDHIMLGLHVCKNAFSAQVPEKVKKKKLLTWNTKIKLIIIRNGNHLLQTLHPMKKHPLKYHPG